jgi:hypothetical protein
VATTLGHHAADWKVFCQLTGTEFVQGLGGCGAAGNVVNPGIHLVLA